MVRAPTLSSLLLGLVGFQVRWCRGEGSVGGLRFRGVGLGLRLSLGLRFGFKVLGFRVQAV